MVLMLATVVMGLAVAQSKQERGRKYKAPPPLGRVEVMIIRDSSERPIPNASVIFHTIEGGRSQGNMQLKTDSDGKAVIDVLPVGDTIRLQVIARGFQTYGEDFKLDKAEMQKVIRMKRPTEQYSVYKDSAKAAGDQKTDTKPEEKPAPPADK